MEKSSDIHHSDPDDESTLSLDRVINIKEFRKSERMVCIICHNLLLNPIKCADCLAHFCQKCLNSWTQKSNTCPNCRANFKREKCERTLKEDLEDTLISCFFKPVGCLDSLKYENVFSHQKNCPLRPTECQWCKLKGKLKEIEEHEQNCEGRKVLCEGCLEKIPYKEISNHELPCLKKEIAIARLALKQAAIPKKKEKKLKFSQNQLFKHEGIRIINKKIAQMKIDEYQMNSVCLMKPKLKNRLVTFKIKIVRLTCWIGLGVGNSVVLQSSNFRLTDSQIENMKHGSFFISSNGIAWSSEVKNENYIQNYTLKNDDIISIEFDPDNKVVKFEKNLMVKTQKMSSNFLSGVSGDIYAMIILGGVDDSVEIIDSKFS